MEILAVLMLQQQAATRRSTLPKGSRLLLSIDDRWLLLVADTGIKGQTRTAVKSVAHLFETQNTKRVRLSAA